jgi:hypothetical protein
MLRWRVGKQRSHLGEAMTGRILHFRTPPDHVCVSFIITRETTQPVRGSESKIDTNARPFRKTASVELLSNSPTNCFDPGSSLKAPADSAVTFLRQEEEIPVNC